VSELEKVLKSLHDRQSLLTQVDLAKMRRKVNDVCDSFQVRLYNHYRCGLRVVVGTCELQDFGKLEKKLGKVANEAFTKAVLKCGRSY